MPKYRVSDRQQRLFASHANWFQPGEIVEVEDPTPEGDGLVFASKDIEGYVLFSALDPVDEQEPVRDYIPQVDPSITPTPTPSTTQPERIWGEHLADIARALQIITDAQNALNTPPPVGTPGNYSDLTFTLPGRVPITLDGVDTGWALVYDGDNGMWMFETGGSSNDG